MSTANDLINIIDSIISNFDPTPTIVNEDFPLRWESGIFISDYDFTENYLDLDESYERSGGSLLKSVGTAIEINKEQDGSFEYWDGAFMFESHVWCNKLNNDEDFPSLSLINQKFRNLNDLTKYLIENYS